MSKTHRISKWALAYHSKFTPWKKRAARGHERAAQKRDWQNDPANVVASSPLRLLEENR